MARWPEAMGVPVVPRLPRTQHGGTPEPARVQRRAAACAQARHVLGRLGLQQPELCASPCRALTRHDPRSACTPCSLVAVPWRRVCCRPSACITTSTFCLMSHVLPSRARRSHDSLIACASAALHRRPRAGALPRVQGFHARPRGRPRNIADGGARAGAAMGGPRRDELHHPRRCHM
eukprot:62041-Prymnesium_polylepis.1